MRLVVGCNYHTTWQSHRAMRFVLLKLNLKTGRAKLGTNNSSRQFWTDIKDLIFIESPHNERKAKILE